jgi:mannosyltransferase OCH1-like enzyme
MSLIPKVIHQTWKTRDIPERLAGWHRSFHDRNPGWTVRLWTDEDNRAFLEQHYGWFLEIYDSYRYPIMRADVIRPFLLYHFGGFYADLDVECVRSLDLLCEGSVDQSLVQSAPASGVGLVLGQETRIMSGPIIGNAVMGSRAGHPFWKAVFSEFEARAKRKAWFFIPRENYILAMTGPDCIDAVWKKTRESWDDILVLRPAALSPKGWWQDDRSTDQAFAIHHYASSWASPWTVFWQRAFRSLGRRRST